MRYGHPAIPCRAGVRCDTALDRPVASAGYQKGGEDGPYSELEYPGAEVLTVRSSRRCAICNRRAPDRMFVLHERLELPVPSQTWLLCGGCAEAVAREVERTALRTPLRVRIAVAMVAAERRPLRRPRVLDAEFWEQMPAQQFDRLAVCFVLAVLAIPPLFFLLVTVLTSSSASGR